MDFAGEFLRSLSILIYFHFRFLDYLYMISTKSSCAHCCQRCCLCKYIFEVWFLFLFIAEQQITFFSGILLSMKSIFFIGKMEQIVLRI